MRMIFSIIGFVLFIVGCQQLVPTSYKYGTLPTHEYGKVTVRSNGEGLRPLIEGCNQLGGNYLIHRGRNTRFTCTLESN